MKNIRTKAEEKARFLLRHGYFNSDDPDLIELALNMDVGY